MLFSVKQAFVGRDEKRASLKRPAWEAKGQVDRKIFLLLCGCPKIVDFVPKRNATYMSGILFHVASAVIGVQKQ